MIEKGETADSEELVEGEDKEPQLTQIVLKNLVPR
jgi:hypothetical protein